jgi:hypothetical protein
MACLIQCFNDWIMNEPEELETDRPTDEEMKAFDEAEHKHLERVRNVVLSDYVA